MILLAGLATLLAGLITCFVVFGNGMRSTPGPFIGRELIFIAWVVVVVLWLAVPASAKDLGQWENTDPAIRQWYRSLMMPDAPAVSCCGTSDAYWTDLFEMSKDGEYIAIITDDRPDEPLKRAHVPVGTKVVIPNHKIKFDGDPPNPTGHGVVFMNAAGVVYCYVAPSGI